MPGNYICWGHDGGNKALEIITLLSLTVCSLLEGLTLLKFCFDVHLENQGMKVRFKSLEKCVQSGLQLKL